MFWYYSGHGLDIDSAPYMVPIYGADEDHFDSLRSTATMTEPGTECDLQNPMKNRHTELTKKLQSACKISQQLTVKRESP